MVYYSVVFGNECRLWLGEHPTDVKFLSSLTVYLRAAMARAENYSFTLRSRLEIFLPLPSLKNKIRFMRPPLCELVCMPL
jgi:hypothetical protein